MAGTGMSGLGGSHADNTYGMVAFGTVMGGVSAELSGGNFWQGAITGLVVSGLNHAMHKIDDGEIDPPTKKKEKLTTDDLKKGARAAKEVGASTEFIDAMDKSLKGNNKVLGRMGKIGGYLSAEVR